MGLVGLNDTMKFTFLGGAEEVGRVGLYVEDGADPFLMDYGFTPSDPPQYPMESPRVRNLILTHAHLDHSGLVPCITGKYGARLVGTRTTLETSEVLLRDSLKIAQEDGLDIQYSKEDLGNVRNYFEPVRFGRSVDLGSRFCTLHNAGHIPGSAMVRVDGDDGFLFTGDMNTCDSMLMEGCSPMDASTVFVEGTYSGKEHEPRNVVARRFLDTVDEVVSRGGKAIVPTFAVGRFQEVIMLLCDMGFDVWADGMGRGITRLYLDDPKALRDPDRLKRALSQVTEVRNPTARSRGIDRGEVFVTTSGMLEGGPVLEYIFKLRSNPKNAILLTGYQVEGTNGDMLLKKGMIHSRGVNAKVENRVEFFDLSAHAGHTELAGFVRDCNAENVVIYHSDDRQPLADELSEFNVILPQNGKTFEL